MRVLFRSTVCAANKRSGSVSPDRGTAFSDEAQFGLVSRPHTGEQLCPRLDTLADRVGVGHIVFSERQCFLFRIVQYFAEFRIYVEESPFQVAVHDADGHLIEYRPVTLFTLADVANRTKNVGASIRFDRTEADFHGDLGA